MKTHFTRKNPTGTTWRIPCQEASGFRMEGDQYNIAYFGPFVDKLGKFEELDLDDETIDKMVRFKRFNPKKWEELLKNINT